MRRVALRVTLVLFCLIVVRTVFAQSISPGATTSVPRVVRLTGIFVPANGMPPAPVETITLAIYGEESGGAPLWQETQYVALDSSGRYTVLLGATQSDGLPLDIFASGDARWVGRRFERAGEQEQARVSLPSVPYALKAADADTLGGLPPSAYLLADPTGGGGAASTGATTASDAITAPTPQALTSGTAGCIGEFTSSTDLGCSPMVDVGGAIGLGTSIPLDRFHVRFTNTTGAFTGLAVQNLGSTASSYSGMLFYDQSGSLGQLQGFNNSTHEYRINNIATSGSINFMLASSSKFQVRTDGNINIAGDLYKGGSIFLNSTGPQSVGLGVDALANSTGGRNNAVGKNTLGQGGAGNSGNYNNALGWSALNRNTSGAANNAVGDAAMFFNRTGAHNTAVGDSALTYNDTGSGNTAIGDSALTTNVAGAANTAVGQNAGYQIHGDGNVAVGTSAVNNLLSGDSNVALGASAGFSLSSGSNNVAVGASAATNLLNGSNNIIVGANAGANLSGGNNNIAIGNPGVNGDIGVVRIGTIGSQSRFFAAGVYGVATGDSSPVPVLIDSNGQLGTTSSSRRFKEDIRDMGDVSRALFALRPVTFRYKKAFNSGAKPIQYGLIAEEVAEVFPDLAVKNAEGGVDTVHYETLSVLLLNEVQRQQRRQQELEEQNQQLAERLAAVEAVLSRSAAATTTGSR